MLCRRSIPALCAALWTAASLGAEAPAATAWRRLADAAGLSDAPSNAVWFLSASDGRTQAFVVHGHGPWATDSLPAEAEAAIETIPDAVWTRLDRVRFTERFSREEFIDELGSDNRHWFRRGVALDESFAEAYLEGELQANGILDASAGGFRTNAIAAYLRRQGGDPSRAVPLPETVWVFDCDAWFLEGTGSVIRLGASRTDLGRRPVVSDAAFLRNLVQTVGRAFPVLESGAFVYERRPISGKRVRDYNDVRHAGCLWYLVDSYEATGDPALLKSVENGFRYVEQRLVETTDGAAFFVNRNGRADAGRQALAVLAYADMSRLAGTNSPYAVRARKLTDGLLRMFSAEGVLQHRFHFENDELSLVAPYSCQFYDGEAAFALARMYSEFGDRRFLDAACGILDRFIAADYDDGSNAHWVAYSTNEITKHEPREAYFKFGLEHLRRHLASIAVRRSANPTANEALVVTAELLKRARGLGFGGDFPDEELRDAIRKRTESALGFLMFPEVAMYFRHPDDILYGFAVRESGFRMRMDDTQHFMGFFMGLLRAAEAAP